MRPTNEQQTERQTTFSTRFGVVPWDVFQMAVAAQREAFNVTFRDAPFGRRAFQARVVFERVMAEQGFQPRRRIT